MALGSRGDDRVVVCDFAVVDHATQWQDVEPQHVPRRVRVVALPAHQPGDGLDRADHVAREVARVRARIGERRVLFVEALGRRQRTASREAIPGIGVALERGEVIEDRRALPALRLLDLGDLARLFPAGADDLGRLLGGL